MNVFSLPSDLLISLVVEWLDWPSFASFDGAVTNKSTRSLMYRTLRSPNCVFVSKPLFEDSSLVARHSWIVTRGLHMDYLSLDLTKSYLSSMDLVLTQNSTLKELDLHCHSSTECNWFTNLILGCCTLTSLHLTTTEGNIDETLVLLIKELPRPELLTSLFVLKNGISLLALNQATTTCKNIKVLKLFSLEDGELDATSSTEFEKLKFLSIINQKTFTTVSSIEWIGLSGSLAELHIENQGSFVNLESYTFLFPLHLLETLILDSLIDEQSLLKIVSNNKRLVVLVTFIQDYCGNGVIQCIMENCSNFKRIALYEAAVSESLWIEFVNTFPTLTSINIRQSGLTTRFIEALTTSCEHVQHLYLHEEFLLTDDEVTMIVMKCTQLLALFLPDSNLLTDLSMFRIVTNCKDLVVLHIFIGNMTYDGLTSLCVGCPKLISLSLYGYNQEKHLEVINRMKMRRNKLKIECIE